MSRTAKSNIFDNMDHSDNVAYDQKSCCQSSGVKDDCLPLCQYNASLSEVRQLTNLCKDDLVKVTKCAAGKFKSTKIQFNWHKPVEF